MAMSGSPFDTPRSFGSGAIESAKIRAGFHATEAVIHRLLERFWSEMTARAALLCNLL
jgi:hypothetical protein